MKHVKTSHFSVDKVDQYTIDFYHDADRGFYECFCTNHPSNSFSEDPAKTHLFESNRICVLKGREPKTLDRAKAVAMMWCEGYSRYIRTGEFPAGKRLVNV